MNAARRANESLRWRYSCPYTHLRHANVSKGGAASMLRAGEQGRGSRRNLKVV